jgi:hypothetical protein
VRVEAGAEGLRGAAADAPQGAVAHGKRLLRITDGVSPPPRPGRARPPRSRG